MCPFVRGVLRGVIAGGAWLASACSGPGATLPLTYDLPAIEPKDARDLSLDVLLVADNQAQYLYGNPVWLRKGLLDKAVATGIRSPSLDLYGQDLLSAILEKEAGEKRGNVTIHLGDALNISCGWEMDRFARVMSAAKRPWFMAIGNHDGFYYGSGRTGPGSSQSEWDAACYGGGGALKKNVVITRYLGLLAEQGRRPPQAPAVKGGTGADPGLAAFAREARLDRSGAFSYRGSEPAVLRRAAWRIDQHYWRSYVVQELDISLPAAARPVRVILLDTSQFDVEPGLAGAVLPGVYDAGSSGFLLSDQLEVIRSWLALDQADGAVVLLMGHHPHAVIGQAALEALNELRAEFDVELYVSAHTHASAFYVNAPGQDKPLELNIGSTLDFPAQYRTLAVRREQHSGRTVIRTQRRELWSHWQSRVAAGVPGYPDCEAHKEAWYPPDSKLRNNRYVNYMNSRSLSSATTHRLILDDLLDSYARLFALHGTAASALWPAGCGDDACVTARIHALRQPAAPLRDMQAFALELDRFEATRRVSNEGERKDYRLCQALWASTADEHGARIPEADQWFVVFPGDAETPRK
jgi:hypothetical protein